ncbi:MAG: hypothetical protein NTY57_03940 [Solirubrobacterales bacterium]|jgi:hypothetical protein|nr:hypothetical protein [Solirubrobacterales bacterium]
MAKRRSAPKPTCAGCHFGANGLCALPDPTPCATFRPLSADGLKAPSQMRFHFREARRVQTVWAFPTPQEQAEIHAVA